MENIIKYMKRAECLIDKVLYDSTWDDLLLMNNHILYILILYSINKFNFFGFNILY